MCWLKTPSQDDFLMLAVFPERGRKYELFSLHDMLQKRYIVYFHTLQK